jgi:hypothetical protein
MFKISLFTKAMLIVVGIFALYGAVIISFVIPKVDNNIQILQEKNAKEVLEKISVITKNVQHDLENYKQESLQNYQ